MVVQAEQSRLTVTWIDTFRFTLFVLVTPGGRIIRPFTVNVCGTVVFDGLYCELVGKVHLIEAGAVLADSVPARVVMVTPPGRFSPISVGLAPDANVIAGKVFLDTLCRFAAGRADAAGRTPKGWVYSIPREVLNTSARTYPPVMFKLARLIELPVAIGVLLLLANHSTVLLLSTVRVILSASTTMLRISGTAKLSTDAALDALPLMSPGRKSPGWIAR
jgi:hypothetical protein